MAKITISNAKSWLWVFREAWVGHIDQEQQAQCRYDIPKIENIG